MQLKGTEKIAITVDEPDSLPSEVWTEITVQDIVDKAGGASLVDGTITYYTPDNTDQTVAFQAAADDAALNGRTLRIKKGTVLLNGTVTINPNIQFDAGSALGLYTTTQLPASANPTKVIINGLIAANPNLYIFQMMELAEVDGVRVTVNQPITLYPEWFGNGSKAPVTGKGGDWSEAWQLACDALRNGNGGKVQGRLNKTYFFRWPLVAMGTNYDIDLNGAKIYTDLYMQGRGFGSVVNIGNGTMTEIGLVKGARRGAVTNYDPRNHSFVDIPLPADPAAGTYYTDTSAVNYTASDIDFYGGKVWYDDTLDQTGNYGVQFSNCKFSRAWDLNIRNGGQMFGFGSDVAPENPYAYGCEVRNLITFRVNQIDTYYSLGFFGYASNCHAVDCKAYGAPSSATGTNSFGLTKNIDCNGVAFAYAFKCSVRGCLLWGNKGNANSNSAAIEMGSFARQCTAEYNEVRDWKFGAKAYNFASNPNLADIDTNRIAYNLFYNNDTAIEVTGHKVILVGNGGDFNGGYDNQSWISLGNNVNGTQIEIIDQRDDISNNPFTWQQTYNTGDTRYTQTQGFVRSRKRWNPTAVVATNGTNSTKLTISLKNGYFITPKEVMYAHVWLAPNASSDGAGFHATAPDSVACSTGVLVTSNNSGKYNFCQSDANGSIVFTITSAAKTTYDVWCNLYGYTRKLATLVTGSYG